MFQDKPAVSAYLRKILRRRKAAENALGVVEVLLTIRQIAAKFKQCGRSHRGCRSVTRSCRKIRCIIVPKRNVVFGLDAGDYHIRNLLRKLKILLVSRLAVADSVAIDAPSLSTCPGRLVAATLESLACFDAAVRIVAYDVIAGHIRTEMAGHCLVGVADCDVFIFIVSGEFARLKKEFEIHHIVNNDREIPRAEIPGTDCPDFRIETRSEIVCRADDDGLETVVRAKTEGVAIAATDHKSEVVCAGVECCREHLVCVVHSVKQESFVSGQLISEP